MKLSFSEDEPSTGLDDFALIDWSFPNLTNSGLNSFHWYPATYLSAIPGTLIPHLSMPGQVVLDPFCGSGTTGVEAIRLARKFVGIDTNPVALLMSEAKLNFADPKRVDAGLLKIAETAEGLFRNEQGFVHANRDELLKWYHPQTFNELNSLLIAILAIRGLLLRRTFLAIFSSVLKNCSSQGRHWGWVCDNVTPKPHEIAYKDAAGTFANAVKEFVRSTDLAFKATQIYSRGVTREEIRSRSQLIQGSCIEKMGALGKSSVDLLVTSPPYYGVADYVKSQRLSYLWFDIDQLAADKLGFRDFEQLRSMEAGARSNRHRKDSHGLYMGFMATFFAKAFTVLKSGARMVLVVGESPTREGTLEGLISSASDAGFDLTSRMGRDIRANRRRLMAKVKGEDVLLFTKRRSVLHRSESK